MYVCVIVCGSHTYMQQGGREFGLFSIPCAQLIEQNGCNKCNTTTESATTARGIREGRRVVTAYDHVEQPLAPDAPASCLLCMYVHMYVCIYLLFVADAVAVGAGCYFNNVLWFWQHLNIAFV